MKNVIIHMTEIKPTTTLASARIAKFMAEWLPEAHLFDTKMKVDALLIDETPIRNLFIVNGPTAFCEFREQIRKLTLVANSVIWVQNDYTCYPPSQMKRALRKRWPELQKRSAAQRPPVMWTTCSEKMTEPIDCYVNWNQLTYDPVNFRSKRDTPPGLFYYGAGRPNRQSYFKKYFNSKLYDSYVSCSARGAGSFRKIAPDVKIVPPLDNLITDVSHWRATVYMEDRYSHRHFTSLANRFYECLSAGIAQFVDINSVLTFTRSGLPVSDEWLVENDKDVARLLPKWSSIAKEQRRRWTEPYLDMLKNQIDEAYEKLEDPKWRRRSA